MIDISEDTNKLINEINDQLTENCPGLQVNIVKKIVDFKLCLFLNDECVSFIVIDDVNNNFNILSRTLANYQGKGYNEFLTAVCIYLADTMTTDLEFIYSRTKVVARIKVLDKYDDKTKTIFVRENSKNDNDDNEDDDDKPNKVPVEEEYEYFVKISPKNKNIAEGIINTWINNKCIKVKTGGKKTRRNKQKRKSKKRKTKRRK